jgi:hypothetical protein
MLNKNQVWWLLVQKFPHAEWCELVTDLWDECDCGAGQQRTKLYGRYLEKVKRQTNARSKEETDGSAVDLSSRY